MTNITTTHNNYFIKSNKTTSVIQQQQKYIQKKVKLECGPMPNVMATLPNIGGALCSTLQSLADAHYQSAVQ